MPTVLVVDDEPKIAQLARDYLEHAGFSVLLAGDGNSAVQSTSVRNPDLVVLDLGLPGIDGLEVMRRLRATPDGAAPVAIGLSGYGQAEDRARAEAAGFDHYLVKPVSPDALLALVAARR